MYLTQRKKQNFKGQLMEKEPPRNARWSGNHVMQTGIKRNEYQRRSKGAVETEIVIIQ